VELHRRSSYQNSCNTRRFLVSAVCGMWAHEARTVIKLLSCVKETQKGLYKSSLPGVELSYMVRNSAQKLPKSFSNVNFKVCY